MPRTFGNIIYASQTVHAFVTDTGQRVRLVIDHVEKTRTWYWTYRDKAVEAQVHQAAELEELLAALDVDAITPGKRLDCPLCPKGASAPAKVRFTATTGRPYVACDKHRVKAVLNIAAEFTPGA